MRDHAERTDRHTRRTIERYCLHNSLVSPGNEDDGLAPFDTFNRETRDVPTRDGQ
jgi:hypothetical protein